MNIDRIKKFAILVILPLLFSVLMTGCQKSWNPENPLKKDAVKIGVIFVGSIEDGYSYAHDMGIKEAQRALGLRDDQIIRKSNVNDADVIMVEHMMSEAIREGANIIFATSWGYMDVCETMALKYPNVIFANASGYKKNETNFTNYFGRVYQARYLSGVAAGLKTKTGKLGFVAAMDKSNSEVTGGLNAFAMGVESVNPDAKVHVKVTYNWFDPAGESQAAQQLIDEGCDVIAQHCDTPMPQITAEKAGAWGIGYNSDMRYDAPDAVLTSVVWNWGVYYTSFIGSVIDGSFTTEPYYGGLAEGMVDVTPLNSSLAGPEMAAAVDSAKARILNENFNVFDGAMKTNDGRIVGTDGATLSDSEITGGIDWYYHNIVEIE